MPASTPNFLLPYPVPGDPADVPTALETLAEQIDLVLKDQEACAVPRPMAQFLGTVPNIIPGTATTGLFTWQLTDFNTTPSPCVFADGPPAVEPVVDAATNQLRVNYSGLWFIFGTVQVERTVPASNIDDIAVEFTLNGSTTPHWARSSTHNVTTGGDTTHLLDASVCMTLAAGDLVGFRGAVARSAGAAPVTFNSRSITLLRMAP